jgi:succinoglycan biosynthesis protein ExoV
MHAAIVADSFRVSWISVMISQWFNAAKWGDWAERLAMDVTITPLFPKLDAIGRLLRSRTPARTPHPEAAAVSDHVITQPQYRKTVRRRIAGLIVAQHLRAISQQTPCLSDPGVLAGKKADYEKILQGIRADYGGGSA